ncbi:Hypothetical protein NTJ_16003 [Nesidiocoris tenuis]|uniref:Uncharacterized protein n=1 Tax=Nesidiocoris tenuis TaxID=355587 RepID=A0ABN7BHB0_9HEMI|nr:Hypothetical protein NTJ_16003 [Nesidiocoris tenuis]
METGRQDAPRKRIDWLIKVNVAIKTNELLSLSASAVLLPRSETRSAFPRDFARLLIHLILHSVSPQACQPRLPTP